MNLFYLLSRYPVLSESFVTRELAVMRRRATMAVGALHPVHARHSDELAAQANAHARLAKRAAGVVKTAVRRPDVTRALLVALAPTPGRWRTAGRVLPAIPRWDIDHVHTHFAGEHAVVAQALARATGASFGVTAHAHDLFSPNPEGIRALLEADLVVTISEATRAFAVDRLGVEPNRARVVRCGVPAELIVERASPLRSAPHLISVGRLVAKKGFDDALRAVALLRRTHDVRLTIVGDGPERPSLTRLVRELGLQEHVTMVGAEGLQAVSHRLDDADVFVLGAKPVATPAGFDADGLPIVLMEALARGVLVVATEVSGIPELIEDGLTGFLARPGDPRSLADGLRRAIETPDVVAIRAAGQSRIRDEYNVESNAGALLDAMALVALR